MATGFLDKTITIDGREHRYVVYVPPGYAKQQHERWPLLVFLNGMGECGTDGSKQVEVGLGPAIRHDPDPPGVASEDELRQPPESVTPVRQTPDAILMEAGKVEDAATLRPRNHGHPGSLSRHPAAATLPAGR